MGADGSESDSNLEGLPMELQEWLQTQAAEREVEETELLYDIIASYRDLTTEVAAGDGPVPSSQPEMLTADEVQAMIDDIRQRIIQVKREVDTKAPQEHTHESLQADIEDLEAAVDGGFENFERILAEVTEDLDTIEQRLHRVAEVLVATRNDVAELTVTNSRRTRVEALQQAAAAAGSSTAICEACGATVDISLLIQPRCPACSRPAADIRERGFLRRNQLITGERPALTGATDSSEKLSVEAVLEEEPATSGDTQSEEHGSNHQSDGGVT